MKPVRMKSALAWAAAAPAAAALLAVLGMVIASTGCSLPSLVSTGCPRPARLAGLYPALVHIALASLLFE